MKNRSLLSVASLRGKLAEARRRLWEIDPRPDLTYRARLMRRGDGGFHERLRWDAFERPHYAYGVYHAAVAARALGIDAVSAIELGVAGGAGLVALEAVAREVSRETGVEVAVVGFDAGSGMPAPVDARDLPWLWQPGHFAMDEQALRQKLSSAELVIGDVAQTVPAFLARERLHPIAFVAFDLDYYSSTCDALPLLRGDQRTLLPRTFCYFDDIVGNDYELHSEHAGELLAIKEFNANSSQRKLALINGLPAKRMIAAPWNHQMFVLHAFDHPLYTRYLALGEEQLAL